jgi:hypothetical protein
MGVDQHSDSNGLPLAGSPATVDPRLDKPDEIGVTPLAVSSAEACR